MSRLVAVEDLRWGGAAEALMGPEESLVVESELEAAFEAVLDEGREGFEQGKCPQCPPESFEDSDGADLADSAESLADVEAIAGVAEELGGELTSLVGDEVPAEAEAGDGVSEKGGDFGGGRLLEEDPSGEGHPGKDIENESELETKDPEKARDVGEVGEKDMLGEARAQRTFVMDGAGLGFVRFTRFTLGRLLFEDPGHGGLRDSPPGPCQSLGDCLVAAEAGEAHGVDELADDVGEAAHGRSGADERGARLFIESVRFPLPPSNGVLRQAEEASRFLGVPN
jgi:hypothetical protein